MMQGTVVRSRHAQSWLPILCLVFCLLTSPRPAIAQSTDDLDSLKKKVDAIQESQKEIKKELEAIRALLTLAGRPVPASLELAAEDSPFRGEKSATVALVEYFDYQCPFCTVFFEETMPQVLTDYILKGKLKFIVRDFPLEEAHPRALQAAEAAHCANEQGKFWPMHDTLMGNSDALERPKLSFYAQDIGLDVSSFDKCVDSGTYASKIKKTMAGGEKIGVLGTPTFFLGMSDATGQKIESLQRLEGAIPFPELKKEIDKLLAEQKPQATPTLPH
jgi:protein-disulfide isomerase